MFQNAEFKGFLTAVEVGKNKVNIKHHQFADDTLTFVPSDEGILSNYFHILSVFSVMPGLRLL